MKLYIKIIILIISFILIGSITAFIDYNRINNNQKPVFSITNYNKPSKQEMYTGILYRIDRLCSISKDEKISDSKSISFKVLGININLKSNVLKPHENLGIKTTEQTKCTESKLVYADKDIKIYTYCLKDILINSYGKDVKLDEYIKKNGYTKILNELRFDGTTIDKKSLELVDINKISNNGIKVIQCKSNNITDIYFGPNNMLYQEDFCTYKDDDFEFFWTIIDKHDKTFKCPVNAEKEVLYEDETNIYSFKCLMSDQIFVNTPETSRKIETNIPIREALDKKLITLEEAINRGLKVDIEKKEIKTQ